MRTSLKTVLLTVAILASAAWLTGCVVPCLDTPFEDKELLFEPALIGNWVKEKEDRTMERFEFTKGEEKNMYQILITDEKGRKASVMAVLGKIGEKTYLGAGLNIGALPQSGLWFAWPPHLLIFRVEEIRPQLKLTMLDYDACRKLLMEKPAAVPHVTYRIEHVNDDSPLITANTTELQKFIKEYGDSAKLFPADRTMIFEPMAEGKGPVVPAKPATPPAPDK